MKAARAIALAALLAAPTVRAQGAVTLIAGGDVVIHRRVAASAAAHRDDGGYAWVLGPLRDELPAAALAFANLETPLTERFRRPANGTPPLLGADPSLAAGLAAAGFDLVSVANNHALDQTAAGLAETLAALAAAGLSAAGGGPSPADAARPAVLLRDGLRVALVAFTDRVNAGPGSRGASVALSPDGARVAAALRAARAVADVVALSIHWSRDFTYAPTAAQRRLARRWILAGADVILGTGPHVLQPVERLASPRGEAVVAWSLGNLVSNQGFRHVPDDRSAPRADPERCPFARDGVLLRVTLVRRPEGLRVPTLEAVPLWTENDHDTVRAMPLRAAPEPLRSARRAAIAAALGPAVTLVD